MRAASTLAAVVIVGVGFGLVGCSSTDTASTQNNVVLQEASGDAEIVLVAMHADWCGACERMGPEVMEAMGQIDAKSVKLVKADLTDRDNPAGKASLDAMGLGDLYKKNGGKTGVLYIVDADSGEVLGKLQGGRAKTETIVADVNAALADLG